MKNSARRGLRSTKPSPSTGKDRRKLSNAEDFCRGKLHLSLWIMGVGMVIALIWNAYQGWVLGKNYPDDTFLFRPDGRFGDFTDAVLFSSRPNPYIDPYAVYFPFALVCLRPLSLAPPLLSLIFFLFTSLGGLYLLLNQVFATVVLKPWKRTFLSLLFIALSYPMLFCIDRGNIELFLVVLITFALFFFNRGKFLIGMLCLLPTISFKLYPALFLVLLVRQRQLRTAVYCVIAFLILTIISLYALSLPFTQELNFYGRDMAFFTQVNTYENYTLEGSSSLWNSYKILLITLADFGLIEPVDFSFDAPFIQTSYFIFSICSAILALFLTIYVCLVEREFLRCAVALLCFLAVATPTGADYRLLYANVALVLVILLRTRRPHDVVVLILLALAMIPKKEIILSFAGRTETGSQDVSIQVLLNPLLVLAALVFLLYDSRSHFDWSWSRLRFARLIRAILPSAFVKT